MMNRPALALAPALLVLASCEFPEGHTAQMRFDDDPGPAVRLVPTASREHDISPRSSSRHAAPLSDREAILAVIRDQAEAWNRGDLDGFMDAYSRSDEVTFSGRRGTIRGRQTVLNRYRDEYPDAAAMGRAEFSDLQITMLGPDSALVLGHWKLQQVDEELGGVFSLVFRKGEDGWKIVHDHTSRR